MLMSFENEFFRYDAETKKLYYLEKVFFDLSAFSKEDSKKMEFLIKNYFFASEDKKILSEKLEKKNKEIEKLKSVVCAGVALLCDGYVKNEKESENV